MSIKKISKEEPDNGRNLIRLTPKDIWCFTVYGSIDDIIDVITKPC